MTLLADSSSTGGALSTVRVSLEKGVDGARPHRHNRSAEMFYVLDGVVDVLAGDEIVRAEGGDVIIVPRACLTLFRRNPAIVRSF